jgi:acyl carrier protein
LDESVDKMKDELRQVLTSVFSLPEGFDEKADLYRDLGMSSMQAMELLMALEEGYAVKVPDEQFIEATSLERLARMMRGLKN